MIAIVKVTGQYQGILQELLTDEQYEALQSDPEWHLAEGMVVANTRPEDWQCTWYSLAD